jgi:hypothetical protein
MSESIEPQKKTGEGIDLMEYYKILIEVWKEQNSSFWTSINVFLVMEGLLFTALFAVSSNADFGPLIIYCIAIVGIVLSLLWLFVSTRKKEALRLVGHQARVLERKLFAANIKNIDDVEGYFSMFFSGNRAVFLKRSPGKERQKLNYEEWEKKIDEYHESRYPSVNAWTDGYSEYGVMTVFFPWVLISIWIAVALAMSAVIAHNLTIYSWLSFIMSTGLLIAYMITYFKAASRGKGKENQK